MDGIILVSKPSGITSHDLVMKVRRSLMTSRIGHTGTLDPMAEGLMILTIGKATKVLPFLSHHFKEYIATMELGKRSDTLDSTGELLEEREVRVPNETRIREVLDSFIGRSTQTPPMYSAKKVHGKHLYEMARENVEIERQPIAIEISEMELLSVEGNFISFRVVCSTGTYIRSLIEDIAAKLGTIGWMSALKRTQIDRFRIEDATQLKDISIETIKLIDCYDLLDDYPYVEADDLKDVLNGRRIKLECDEPLVMIVKSREVYAAYEKGEDGYYYCKRGLF